MVDHPPQRMHDPPHPVFRSLILRSPRTIQVTSSAADKDETSILLLARFDLAVLSDKVMRSQLGSVHHAVDVDVDDLQIRLLGA
jgi:hypothetical protein